MGSSIAVEKDINLGLKKQAVPKHLTCSMEVSDLYPLVCPHNYQHTLFTSASCLDTRRSLNALSKIR